MYVFVFNSLYLVSIIMYVHNVHQFISWNSLCSKFKLWSFFHHHICSVVAQCRITKYLMRKTKMVSVEWCKELFCIVLHGLIFTAIEDIFKIESGLLFLFLAVMQYYCVWTVCMSVESRISTRPWRKYKNSQLHVPHYT